MPEPTETETTNQETQVTETTPTITTTEQGSESTQTQPTDDLLTRVSKFQSENDSSSNPGDNDNVFNSKELDDSIATIEDPVFKSKMEAMRKSLVSGANEKFQEIATLRKEMQSFMEGKVEEWTPERVQALTKDQKFIDAAQQVAGNENAEDPLGYLDDSAKNYIKNLEDRLTKSENKSNQAFNVQQQQLRETQHNELSGKYANYDKTEMDTIYYDMLEGKIQATPEHIYKAFKHDDNVKRAYQLGRKDEREGVQEKIQSSSAEGIQTTSSNEEIIKKEGESNQSVLSRIIDKNLRRHRSKG